MSDSAGLPVLHGWKPRQEGAGSRSLCTTKPRWAARLKTKTKQKQTCRADKRRCLAEEAAGSVCTVGRGGCRAERRGGGWSVSRAPQETERSRRTSRATPGEKKNRKNPHLRFLKAPIWRLHMACVAQSRSQTDEIFKEPGACRQEGWVEQDCLLKKQICNNNYGMFFLYQYRSLVTLSIWGWGAKRQDFPEESSA